MSVLVGTGTRLVVQGITGNEGTFHTLRNRAYGTQVVAGVTPGKAGIEHQSVRFRRAEARFAASTISINSIRCSAGGCVGPSSAIRQRVRRSSA